MIKYITKFFSPDKSNGRSQIVFKNALTSLMLKGFGIVLSFIFVPIYLSAVGQKQYGIILTITSISYFISFFDVGIGNGLRTKLGKAIADGNRTLGRQYVSTAYYYVSILFGGVFLVYCLVAHWVNWAEILNIPSNEIKNLDFWVFIVLALFCMRFILNLLGTVLMADQKTSTNDFIAFSQSLILLIVCYLLKVANNLNFYTLLVATCFIPIITLIIYTIVFFKRQYKWLSPSLSFVDHELRKDLLTLGYKFFVIQIVALTIFSTTNILIAQLFSIGDVTRYNIAYKYYNMTAMVFSILMSPLWGAFTNAWYQGDVEWIKKKIKFYLLLVLFFCVANIAQYFIYPYFIHFWLKQEFFIPISLAFSFILYNFIFCYNDIFAHFLAGIGKINKQVIAAVIGGVLNIPITIYLAKNTSLGLSVILFANVICLLPSTVVTTLQTIQLLKKGRVDEL